jgi:uridine phosphorylase
VTKITKKFVFSSEDTIKVSAQMVKKDLQELILDKIAFLVIPRSTLERLLELTNASKADWIPSGFHPYCLPEKVFRGTYEGIRITIIEPIMSSSPFAVQIEDLITCGIETIFLLCGAWALGPTEIGDIVIPEVSVGPDGTSPYYYPKGSLKPEFHVDPDVVEALAEGLEKAGFSNYVVGKNASCEAFYRISNLLKADFEKQGCSIMENGEANTLLAIAKEKDILAGILFYAYLSLNRPLGLPDQPTVEKMRTAGRAVADAALFAVKKLVNTGKIKLTL